MFVLVLNVEISLMLRIDALYGRARAGAFPSHARACVRAVFATVWLTDVRPAVRLLMGAAFLGASPSGACALRFALTRSGRGCVQRRYR